ncbi:MAG TPA: hypothetical protein VKV25_04330 [Acidimicrobiales bacterium]|nr:hypothetical protein [Acidimicrobiales bacterium]
MPRIPTAPVAAGALIAGYLTARQTKKRPLGGAVLAAGTAWCGRRWWRQAGPGATAALVGLQWGAMGASHPLAKKVGAWPAVFTVAAASGLAAWALADRR